MTDHDADPMDTVDDLLRDVRQTVAPVPSEALMARIAADAAAAHVDVAAPETLGWRSWLEALGGWPAMGGLATAGVAGLWLGVAPTTGVSDVLAGVFGDTVMIEATNGIDIFGLEAEG